MLNTDKHPEKNISHPDKESAKKVDAIIDQRPLEDRADLTTKENQNEETMALNSLVKTENQVNLRLEQGTYQFIEGIRATSEERYSEKLGKKRGKIAGFILYDDSSISFGQLDFSDEERVLLLNDKNQQFALMSNRLLLHLYRKEDAAILAERFHLQLKYKQDRLKIYHFSSDSRELLKNYYLLKEAAEVQEVSLEIIENPSVAK